MILICNKCIVGNGQLAEILAEPLLLTDVAKSSASRTLLPVISFLSTYFLLIQLFSAKWSGLSNQLLVHKLL